MALKLDHLPAEGESELELDEGADLNDALCALRVSEDTSYLTLVNGKSVPRTQRTKTILVDGDTLTLFSPIKGG